MPRYRFSWSNVDPELRRALCGDVDDGSTSTETQLRSQYGARPKEVFVSDCWSVLREEWLAADSAARGAIVGTLRAAGLGDQSIEGASLGQHLAYLRSCRNRQTPRQGLLATCVGMCERGPQDKP